MICAFFFSAYFTKFENNLLQHNVDTHRSLSKPHIHTNMVSDSSAGEQQKNQEKRAMVGLNSRFMAFNFWVINLS